MLGSRVQPGRAPVEALLLPALERLLAAGADPDAQDERGVGPLHAAAIHGLARCTGRLLAAGADPERRDRLGRRPADLARLLGYPALCALFEQFRAPRPERGRSRSDRDSPLS
ncbi:MAG: ankyrin repeat domain-containing protein [Xanthomonadales bacterium]|nr:ankyrin repeat domain-containing protein [Xanthomonadales bacterium]